MLKQTIPLVNSRRFDLFAFLFCFLLILTTVAIEITTDAEPCPLCVLQRIVFGVIGITLLFSFLGHNKKQIYRCMTIIGFLFAIFGFGLTINQIWLQYFAPNDQICGLSISYMLEYLPLVEIFRLSLRGTGSCQEIHSNLLGINLAFWYFLFFLGFIKIYVIKFFTHKFSHRKKS